MTYAYSTIKPSREAILGLYEAVGWTEYLKNPQESYLGVDNSTRVVTAAYGNQMVGMARVLSDRYTIMYLQDILVHPDHRRKGVGAELFRRVTEPYAMVRQKVLMTDTEPEQRAFYEAQGYTEVRDLPGEPTRVFVKIGQ